jgi:tRNA A37 methylthiotransferase MiaB
MLAQQKIAFEKNKSRIGSTLTCLVDSIEKNHTAKARFFAQAPDIDPLCIIKNCNAKAGSFINAEVTGFKNYDLLCEQI